MKRWGAHVIKCKILNAPAIATGQQHDLGLKFAFSSIAADRLGANIGLGLVISRDPWSRALVRHFPGEVAIYAGEQLVVKVYLVPGGREENGIYQVAILDLI